MRLEVTDKLLLPGMLIRQGDPTVVADHLIPWDRQRPAIPGKWRDGGVLGPGGPLPSQLSMNLLPV